MPEQATRPTSTISPQLGEKLRTVAKLHRRRKRTVPKEMTIIIRCITKPASLRFWPCLTKNHSIHLQEVWPSTTFCLFLSGEKRQVVDESHKYRSRGLPKPFSLSQISSYLVLPSLPTGATEVLDGASHHAQRREARPNPTSLLGIPVERNFLGRVKKDMDGPMTRGPRRGTIRKNEKCDLLLQACRINTVEAAESDSR